MPLLIPEILFDDEDIQFFIEQGIFKGKNTFHGIICYKTSNRGFQDLLKYILSNENFLSEDVATIDYIYTNTIIIFNSIYKSESPLSIVTAINSMHKFSSEKAYILMDLLVKSLKD